MYPGGDMLDFVSEAGTLMFRFQDEVMGLNDICSANVSSDKAVVM
jgi:hypothetical protein